MNVLLLLAFSIHVFASLEWQGHRGARGLYPENTIAGMKLATTFPINTLELDVVLSKDQQVVLSHEPWMGEEICLDLKGKPVAAEAFKLKDLTYAEIKKFDCGSKPHPRFPRQKRAQETKPLLKTLIQEMEKHLTKTGLQLNYNIEIKSDAAWEKAGLQNSYEAFTPVIMDQIIKELPVDRFTIQSFDWRVLKLIKGRYPQVKLVALRETAYDAKSVIKELGFVPDIFSPELVLLSAADVAYFHKEGSKVIVWTVNTLEEMQKAIGLGVDGIITDYPDLIEKLPKGSFAPQSSCLEAFQFQHGKCVKKP